MFGCYVEICPEDTAFMRIFRATINGAFSSVIDLPWKTFYYCRNTKVTFYFSSLQCLKAMDGGKNVNNEAKNDDILECIMTN